MPDVSFGSLFAVMVIGVLVPLLLGLAPRLRVPAAALEILAGIAVGPHGLGWVAIDLPVQITALLGLAFLLFLAGLEIDVRGLRGPPLELAAVGYAVSVVLGLLAGSSLHAAGWVRSPLLVAVTLSATSLGLVVPVLKDAGLTAGALGRNVLASCSVAEFGSVVLLSLFFSTSGGSTGGRVVLLATFVGLVSVTASVVMLAGRSTRLGEVLQRLQDTTAEIRVRAAVALLVAFAALAERFGLESILGAFLAGAVVGLVDRDSSSHPRFRGKVEAVGYGFVIPVFFVASGLRLDLGGLFASPAALLRIPLFLAALLLVRGLPALLYRRSLGIRASLAAGMLQATSLAFIVTVTQIGLALGLMGPVTAAALVCAGVLSVLLFPAGALTLLRDRRAAPRPTGSGSRTDAGL
ncbi:cation:proton antiporter [Streptacidiphilus sp. ASG 303]|uniref:cation:proton antiporter n=1 Tax=Streptacidiphilus sp. ASG 303 TaxID=2896847 RepID=UPI001E2AE5FE|nr:cation:proton antiporter [Streptacidiphilus sp. ASG 303]MCD0484052.1 cation:proton antiporter [Streptacidiphilus sp. ASG 303]